MTILSVTVRTVSNDIVVSTTDVIGLKSWDDVLTFDGDITLASDATLRARRSLTGVNSADNTGVYPTPGPRQRNPIVISGDIDESGSHSLTVIGGGVLVLNGTNTYTGGTVVGGGNSGSLVFGSASSVPASGLITLNSDGYAGVATPGDFAGFLAKVDLTVGTPGAVGVDTQPGLSTPTTFADNIDLTGFTNFNIRIGTATSAILTGTITPNAGGGGHYRFGNGGGTLYVQSPLTVSGGRGVRLNNSSSVPLTLYLQGANTYTGGTVANSGFIIFDGPSTLPGVGSLTASGSSTSVGNSYISYTDDTAAADTAGVAAFLLKFSKANTWGIVGFDASNLLLTPNVNVTGNIDLTGFHDGVFIGTTTAATLSGVLTPSTVTNVDNAPNTLRFTAAKGGVLTVNSTITDNGSPVAVLLGTPSGSDLYSNGTVVLNGVNTYTGGTTINSINNGGLTLAVGNNSALGAATSPLNIPQNVIAGLQASTGGIALPNPIAFAGGASPGQLFITGGNGLELDGVISGPGSISVMDPSNFPYLSLGADNTFTGDISLYNATLSLYSQYAAGAGTIRFLNNSTLNLDTPASVIYGISGETGSITMNNGQSLTIDISNSNNSHEFGGFMGNESSPNASLTVTSSTGGDALYLYGNNNYSGGTFIINKGAVALGDSNALGSGTVTLNTTIAGALAVNAGVTFSNDLVYTGGTLQGFGTFSPTSVNYTPGGPIAFGSGQGVVGGVFGLGNKGTPGTLTITTGVDFANGGAMVWMLQDANHPGGYSVLNVNGANLNFSASAGGFKIFMASLDNTGAAGFAGLTGGQAYTFAVATTTGGGQLTVNGGSWTNFDSTAFTLDTSMFQNPFIVSPYLSADANNLSINFTAVPEPETYALMGLGLGAVLFPALRRSKRV